MKGSLLYHNLKLNRRILRKSMDYHSMCVQLQIETTFATSVDTVGFYAHHSSKSNSILHNANIQMQIISKSHRNTRAIYDVACDFDAQCQSSAIWVSSKLYCLFKMQIVKNESNEYMTSLHLIIVYNIKTPSVVKKVTDQEHEMRIQL